MKKVPAYGPLDARIMIVGEAPGAEEVREGRPFVGNAGKLLRQFLMEVGIDPLEIYYTNICKYQPPGNKLAAWHGVGGLPNETVCEGLIELESEIRTVKPNVILACGNFPLQYLTGKARWIDKTIKGERVRGFTGIQDYRGSILPCALVAGYKVLATFHPAYIAREGMSDHGTFKVDLARLADEAAFPELRRPQKNIVLASHQPVHLANYSGVLDEEAPIWTPAPMSRFDIRDQLLSTPDTPTTLDIEYIGSRLLCVGLTNDKDQAFVLPNENLADLRFIFDIVNNTKLFNAQNAMFDASVLEWHYGLKIMSRVVYDTMLAANAANIELPKGLDYLVSVYTRQPYYKGMVDWKLIKKGVQPVSTVYAYNGIDVWTQHEVMEEQLKWEFDDPAVKKTFAFMMRMLLPLWNMSKRGIRIDLELMQNVGAELDGEAAARAFELMLLAGKTDIINVKSNAQIAELLYNQLRLPVIKENKTGPACDDKTLAALVLKATNDDQRNAIRLIRQIRNARDLRSKFFNIEFDDDGRMRGHYDPTKTVTGRLASRKFYPTERGTNQQNIPRDKRARRAFIADPKKVFGYADLEKAESLVVAHLTRDPLMLLDHSPGQNAHKNLGARLFNKDPRELTEDEYYLSKQTRHAGNYMQGWSTFMRNVNQRAHITGVSIEAKEAKYFIGTYRDLHPGLPRWWKWIEAELWRGRTLYNLIGRKRVFYGHIQSLLPEAVAFTPQSTVGDTLNIGLLNLSLDDEGKPIPAPYLEDRQLWDQYKDIALELREYGFDLLQQIHDAVGFQLYEKYVDKAVPLIRRALQIPLANPFTYEDFTINVEVMLDLDPEHLRQGKSNWGDCKPYTRDLVA